MFKKKSEISTRGHQGKLLPTKSQAKKLSRWIGSCRFLYNAGLEHRVSCYNLQHKKSISYSDQQNSLPAIKNNPEFLWLKEVPSQALQMALQN